MIAKFPFKILFLLRDITIDIIIIIGSFRKKNQDYKVISELRVGINVFVNVHIHGNFLTMGLT